MGVKLELNNRKHKKSQDPWKLYEISLSNEWVSNQSQKVEESYKRWEPKPIKLKRKTKYNETESESKKVIHL